MVWRSRRNDHARWGLGHSSEKKLKCNKYTSTELHLEPLYCDLCHVSLVEVKGRWGKSLYNMCVDLYAITAYSKYEDAYVLSWVTIHTRKNDD